MPSQNRLKENNPRLSRWSLALQPYNFEVKYRAGKANGNADALLILRETTSPSFTLEKGGGM